MAHNVICVYCKQTFDRDRNPFEQVSARRYAHKECADAEAEKSKDKYNLEEYIKSLFNVTFVSPRIRKQINNYMEQYNYTYSGIQRALEYFYQIKGNSIEKANDSIGIVPYIYQDAYNYFYSLWLAKEKNKDKEIQSYAYNEVKTEKVKIPIPKRNIKKKKSLFTFLDEEVDENGQ